MQRSPLASSRPPTPFLLPGIRGISVESRLQSYYYIAPWIPGADSGIQDPRGPPRALSGFRARPRRGGGGLALPGGKGGAVDTCVPI